MLLKNRLVTGVFVVVFLVSSIMVIKNVHDYRRLAGIKNNNDLRKDKLNSKWGQLILEHQTLSEPSRIERLSRSQLGMVSPLKNDIRYLVLE